MKIKIKDSIFAHQEFSTPSNNSELMQWDRSSPTDESELVIYTDCNLYEYRRNSNNNIAWLIEPREYHSLYYQWLESNYSNFKEVWTHDDLLLNKSDKFKCVPWGGCWINNKDQQIYKKSKLCSIIASGKNQLKGHRLRHYIIQHYKGFDLYGYGYRPVENKIEALKDYMFSICIENSQSDNYFTEKIIDCFRTGTVPIYWGARKINTYFNSKGILQFNTFEELEYHLNTITPEKYLSMAEYIQENFNIAKNFLTIEDWLITNKFL